MKSNYDTIERSRTQAPRNYVTNGRMQTVKFPVTVGFGRSTSFTIELETSDLWICAHS